MRAVVCAVHLRDERATPVPESDNYYVSHLDEPAYSPVIYGGGGHCRIHGAWKESGSHGYSGRAVGAF